MVRVYVLNIKEKLDEPTFTELCKYVSVEKKEKINRFLRYEDRLRALFADLIVRYLLSTEYHTKNEEIQFSYNDYGKPSIKNLSNVQFNVSHSGEWVVCAIGDMEIGIDVEEVSKADFDIVKRFFSTEEAEAFSKVSEAMKKELFYELWTSKESYIKAVGKGLSIPLNSFSVLNYSVMSTMENSEIAEGWTLKPLYLDEKYKLTVCSKSHEIKETVNQLSIQNLKDLFMCEENR